MLGLFRPRRPLPPEQAASRIPRSCDGSPRFSSIAQEMEGGKTLTWANTSTARVKLQQILEDPAISEGSPHPISKRPGHCSTS